MSNNFLINAAKKVLKLQQRDATIERPGNLGPFNLKVTPSNYFRNMEGPSYTAIEGREFIIFKEDLSNISYPEPIRGDVIRNTETGKHTITEVREMTFLSIIGAYRVRTE